jgi:hypothetical protein
MGISSGIEQGQRKAAFLISGREWLFPDHSLPFLPVSDEKIIFFAFFWRGGQIMSHIFCIFAQNFEDYDRITTI